VGAAPGPHPIGGTGEERPVIVAVDWSGRARGAEHHIWIAEAAGGRLRDLRPGGTREQTIARLIDLRRAHASLVVGLDFAFSFPRAYMEQRGWTDACAAWAAMRAEAETLLAACPAPFWGRPGTRRPATALDGLRRTELELAAAGLRPKPVLQIGGAGAVGTGSLRGMRHLAGLAEAGFAIWPFDPPGPHTVVEIYPRLLTGQVRKSRRAEREQMLDRRFPGLTPELRERAAGSEDAFDAAVSALVMERHAGELARLPAQDEPDYRLEGRVWWPPALGPGR
jgi:hypothetical protein